MPGCTVLFSLQYRFKNTGGSRNTQTNTQDRFKNRRRPAPDRAQRTTRKETHGRVSAHTAAGSRARPPALAGTTLAQPLPRPLQPRAAAALRTAAAALAAAALATPALAAAAAALAAATAEKTNVFGRPPAP